MADKVNEQSENRGTAWQKVGGNVPTLSSYLLTLAGEKGTRRTEEEEDAILRQRAVLLARKHAAEEEAERVEALQFQLAYERYAIETTYIREVIQLREIVPLPHSPNFLLGIMNLRGEPMSVLDIRKFFTLPGTPLSDLNRVIVLRDGAMSFGVLVDRIHEILSLPASSIFREKVLVGDLPRNYIAGITSARLILLDARALLNDASIVIKQIR